MKQVGKMLCLLVFFSLTMLSMAFAEKVVLIDEEVPVSAEAKNGNANIPDALHYTVWGDADTIKLAQDDEVAITTGFHIVEARLSMKVSAGPKQESPVIDLNVLVDLEKPLIKITGGDIQGIPIPMEKLPYKTVQKLNQWLPAGGDKFYLFVKNYTAQNLQTIIKRSPLPANFAMLAGPDSSQAVSSKAIEALKQYQLKPVPAVIQADAPETVRSFAGKWKTAEGVMEVKVVADSVACWYKGKALKGKIDQNRIVGEWSDTKFFSSVAEQGKFRLTLLPGGCSMKIEWQDDNTDTWVIDSTADKTK